MLGRIITTFLLLFVSTNTLSNAASIKENKNGLAAAIAQLPIATELITLDKLSTNSPQRATQLLNELKMSHVTFNEAEQFLLLLTEAKLRQHEKQHNKAIELLEQAKLLSESIAKEQLNSPIFSNVYLVLAQSYAALKDYKNAFENKKIFVDKLNDFSDVTREDTVDKLTKKYDIAQKREANQLLENQNKLKDLRIGEVQRQQQEQQNKFMLIFCTILLFVLFFLRQLKVRKKLLVLAQTDSLTGLLNRSSLYNKGQALTTKARDEELEFSVLLFDIDNFKLINDEFGHPVGDKVIQKIAILVNETMRSRDIFSRIGGEEFVALLPRTDIAQAKAIAVRVLEKVSQNNFQEFGINQRITISIGVASIKDTKKEFDDILHAADLAMYQAKAQGRNQMVSYESIAKDQERRQP